MTLSDFIENQIESILTDWEDFARTRLPAAEGLSSRALRDEAKMILFAAAADMRTEQTDAEQAAKSQGLRPGGAPEVTAKAREHAQDRFSQGFTLEQLVSEFRALRASVMRLWAARVSGLEPGMFDELIRFNETLDQALTESISWYAARLEESRDLLLGVLGHDLRSPLGAIHMSALYLLRTDGLSGAHTKAANRVLNSTLRMRQMVDDLLDFTRTRLGGGLPIAPRAADIAEVCHDVVDEMAAFHPERVLRFESSGPLDGHWDVQRLKQLLTNLVANALYHGDPATPVTVTARGEADGIVVLVHNEGPPIAPEIQHGIFEPLKRTVVQEAERREGASGLRLGLYIARQIAVAHSGSIEIASGRRDGTTFIVRLPREPRASEQRAAGPA